MYVISMKFFKPTDSLPCKNYPPSKKLLIRNTELPSACLLDVTAVLIKGISNKLFRM
jgi:hypothetical protein